MCRVNIHIRVNNNRLTVYCLCSEQKLVSNIGWAQDWIFFVLFFFNHFYYNTDIFRKHWINHFRNLYKFVFPEAQKRPLNPVISISCTSIYTVADLYLHV